MYKLAGEERFLLWAVCSIQLQVLPSFPPLFFEQFGIPVAYSCDDFGQVLCDKSGEKLLLLAEGLLKKHIASHSMHEPEGKFTNVFSCTSCGTISDFFTLSSTNDSMVFSALMVYISLLEQQSKYNDALEVLSGDLGSLLMIEVDKLRIQVGYKTFWLERTVNFMLFVLYSP
jgi:N-terminal acetyltransferase B complex non-catalytic subunit